METEKDVYLIELNIQNIKNQFYFLYFMGREEPDFVLKKENKIVLIHKKTRKFYSFLLKYFGTDNIKKCLDAKLMLVNLLILSLMKIWIREGNL